MNRPTKDQVEAALCIAERLAADRPIAGDDEYILEAEVITLAEEVKALREVNEKLYADREKQEQLREYHAEVDKLRGDEQDAWVRLGAELCEAETERDKLRADVKALVKAALSVEEFLRDNVYPDTANELREALDKISLPK